MVTSIKAIDSKDNWKYFYELLCSCNNNSTIKPKRHILILNEVTMELFVECWECGILTALENNELHHFTWKLRPHFPFKSRKKIIVEKFNDKMACFGCSVDFKESILINIKPLFDEKEKLEELILTNKTKNNKLINEIEVNRNIITALKEERRFYEDSRLLKHTSKKKNKVLQTPMLELPNKKYSENGILELIMEIPKFIAIQMETSQYIFEKETEKYYLFKICGYVG